MFLRTLNISASGLSAQRYRLNIISQNMTNAQTTRTENGDGPYRRKVTVFQAVDNSGSFENYLRSTGNSSGTYLGAGTMRSHSHAIDNSQLHSFTSRTNRSANDSAGGVKIVSVEDDPTPNNIVYDPEHPDANEEGYVEMPNVEMVTEMVDMMEASRAYEANVQMINAIKTMAAKALEIGK